jgi:UrcA family protein
LGQYPLRPRFGISSIPAAPAAGFQPIRRLQVKAILTAAWAAVLFVTSLPAAATQPDWDQRSVKVDYSDLDLTKAHGVSALQHRVTGAIRQVCDNGDFSLQEKMQQRACAKQAGSKAAIGVDQAIAAARQKMDWANSSGTTAASGTGKPFFSSSQQPGIAREPLPKR